MRKLVILLLLLCAASGYAQTEDKTIAEILEMAKAGNAEAQFEIGACYYEGDGVQEDHKEAAKWWKKAASQGNPEAQNNLGALYYGGDGVRQDDKEARKWWQKAAEQGSTEAQCNLNTMAGLPSMSVKNEVGNRVQR